MDVRARHCALTAAEDETVRPASTSADAELPGNEAARRYGGE